MMINVMLANLYITVKGMLLAHIAFAPVAKIVVINDCFTAKESTINVVFFRELHSASLSHADIYVKPSLPTLVFLLHRKIFSAFSLGS